MKRSEPEGQAGRSVLEVVLWLALIGVIVVIILIQVATTQPRMTMTF